MYAALIRNTPICVTQQRQTNFTPAHCQSIRGKPLRTSGTLSVTYCLLVYCWSHFFCLL